VQAVEVDLIRLQLRRLPSGGLVAPTRRRRRNFTPLALGVAHVAAQGCVMAVAAGLVVIIVLAHAVL